jgi:hypothetical protein
MKGNFQGMGPLVKATERFLWPKVIFIILLNRAEMYLHVGFSATSF